MEEIEVADVNQLLIQALEEANNIQKGEVFLVKDLFKGYFWNRIPRKNRLLLGTLFLNEIKKDSNSIQPITKTTSGQQRYLKIK